MIELITVKGKIHQPDVKDNPDIAEDLLNLNRTLEEKLDVIPVEVILRAPSGRYIGNYGFLLTPWDIGIVPVGMVSTDEVCSLLKDLSVASIENMKMYHAYKASAGKEPTTVHECVGLMKALEDVRHVRALLPYEVLKHDKLNVRLVEVPQTAQ